MSLAKYAYESMVVNALKHHVHTATQSNAEVMQSLCMEDVRRDTGLVVLWASILLFRVLFYRRLVTRYTGARKQ